MSRTDLFKKVELAANVSIVIVALLLSIVLVKSYLLTKPPPSDPNQAVAGSEIRVGQALDLPGVDWAKNGQTLILALSTTCHFCTESGPFYQKIAKERSNTRLLTLLPQSVEEGRQYLRKLGVEVSEVRRIPIGGLGLNSTPTLILVNNKGVVIGSWVGKLPADKEAEVLSQLG